MVNTLPNVFWTYETVQSMLVCSLIVKMQAALLSSIIGVSGLGCRQISYLAKFSDNVKSRSSRLCQAAYSQARIPGCNRKTAETVDAAEIHGEKTRSKKESPRRGQSRAKVCRRLDVRDDLFRGHTCHTPAGQPGGVAAVAPSNYDHEVF